jgi:ABC-type dipeptide/oligopeptide/nickel transport system permease subunit
MSGFRVLGTAKVPAVSAGVASPSIRSERVLRRVLTQWSGAIGAGIVGAWIVVAIAAPLIAPANPDTQNLLATLVSPGHQGYLLGSDELGRDILSRVLFGARDALAVSCVGALIGSVAGTAAGMFVGFAGGASDAVVMRVSDLLLAYPGLVVGVMTVAVLGPGVFQIGIAIALINFPLFARLARAEVLRERELDYVAAATLQGCSRSSILFRQIFPNTFSSALVQLGTSMGQAVTIEAALSFVGFGVRPPTPTWGSLLSGSLPYLNTRPVYALSAAVALVSLILGFNLLSDAVATAADPHRRRR